jgi:hypothetical protein
MRIKQLYCGLDFFREGLKKKYNFEEYTNRQEPLFILGCYDWRAWSNICLRHESLVVLCFAGLDSQVLTDPLNTFWVKEFKKHSNIKYIATSHWIKEDLERVGLPFYKVPVTPFAHNDIKPYKLGDSIYMYKPNVERYGSELYHKIKERLPQYNFIEADGCTKNSRKELLKIYRKCFLGLRLMDHDGFATTVCEMGLMGRRVIHNGDHPNCIHYNKNNIDDIIEKIRSEYDYSYSFDRTKQIAQSMKDYLNIGEDFLNTEYYG